VSFPAAIRHNYNLLFQAVRAKPVEENMTDAKSPEALPEKPVPAAEKPAEKKPEEPTKVEPKKPEMVIDATTGKPVPLPDVKPYNPSGAPGTPLPEKKDKEDKGALLDVGKDVLKIARDVVKEQNK